MHPALRKGPLFTKSSPKHLPFFTFLQKTPPFISFPAYGPDMHATNACNSSGAKCFAEIKPSCLDQRCACLRPIRCRHHLRHNRRIQPIILGGAKLPRVRREGRRARVRGSKCRERGGVLGLGEGACQPQPHQLQGSGERCLPSGVRVEAPAAKMLSYFLETQVIIIQVTVCLMRHKDLCIATKLCYFVIAICYFWLPNCLGIGLSIAQRFTFGPFSIQPIA